MFILRRYTGEQREVNQDLGNSYHLVRRESDFEDFKRTYTTMTDGLDWVEDDTTDKIYYIMTENGATFANLTFK